MLSRPISKQKRILLKPSKNIKIMNQKLTTSQRGLMRLMLHYRKLRKMLWIAKFSTKQKQGWLPLKEISQEFKTKLHNAKNFYLLSLLLCKIILLLQLIQLFQISLSSEDKIPSVSKLTFSQLIGLCNMECHNLSDLVVPILTQQVGMEKLFE